MEKQNLGSWFDLLDYEQDYRLSTEYDRDYEYWREQLARRPEPVTLSGKPAARSHSFIRCTDHLTRKVFEELRAFGAAHAASFPQVVAAAFALYLHRLTGALDLILCLPVTGRNEARMRGTVGMVSNVLPLRVVIDLKDSFDDLLRPVSCRMRQCLRHQRNRAGDLQSGQPLSPEELGLYDTIVNIMPFDYDLRFAGYPSHAHNLSLGPVAELAIAVYDRRDGSNPRISFNTPNQANYTAEVLASHQRRFWGMLAQLLMAPGMPLHRLEILGPEERHMLLKELNDTARPLPEATLPQLFEAQVERDPASDRPGF